MSHIKRQNVNKHVGESIFRGVSKKKNESLVYQYYKFVKNLKPAVCAEVSLSVPGDRQVLWSKLAGKA